MGSLDILRVWVTGVGVMLALTYIKTLCYPFTDKENKNVGKEYANLTDIVSLNVLVMLIWLVQGVRLALSLGFILGAITLINSIWMGIPLVLLVTDSSLVVKLTLSSCKNLRNGTVADKIANPKRFEYVVYVVNLILVAVTIGMLY